MYCITVKQLFYGITVDSSVVSNWTSRRDSYCMVSLKMFFAVKQDQSTGQLLYSITLDSLRRVKLDQLTGKLLYGITVDSLYHVKLDQPMGQLLYVMTKYFDPCQTRPANG